VFDVHRPPATDRRIRVPPTVGPPHDRLVCQEQFDARLVGDVVLEDVAVLLTEIVFDMPVVKVSGMVGWNSKLSASRSFQASSDSVMVALTTTISTDLSR